MDGNLWSTASPAAASIVGNRWDDIDVPAINSWRPQRRVTVVIPYFERQRELDRTLSALTVQTYPRDLIEVVVIDDGSAVAPTVDSFVDVLDVSVHSQEDRGYGLARARNLGARVASGEILVFVDCDMIAESQHLEAHARWHHAVSNAIVFGFRWHADFSSCEPLNVADAVEDGDVRRLLLGQTPQRPEWIERRIELTSNLTGRFDDLFRVTSGGNLSIRRDFFLDVGGNDESFDQWGGEDNEFGFRAIQAGAVVVPERRAVCWHQGEGQRASAEELRSSRAQAPKLHNLIAELGYRTPKPGCSYTVPYGVVSVDGRVARAETTIRTVESVLASRFDDLVVVVTMPDDDYQARWLERRFPSDHRVRVVREPLDFDRDFRFSPLRVSLPSGLLFHVGTMGRIASRVRASGVGLLRSETVLADGTLAVLFARSTRAVNRARRIVSSAEDRDEMIAELFGEQCLDGESLGLGFLTETGDSLDPADSKTQRGAPVGEQDEVASLRVQITAMRSRRALRLADAAGALASARTRQQLRAALAAMANATRRSSSVRDGENDRDVEEEGDSTQD